MNILIVKNQMNNDRKKVEFKLIDIMSLFLFYDSVWAIQREEASDRKNAHCVNGADDLGAKKVQE